MAAIAVPVAASAAPVAHSAAVTNVTRISGSARDATAIAASQDQFAATGSAKAVVLTRNDTYPDALAGGPLAAAKGGPLLLTGTTSLDPAVQAEMLRVLPKGGAVYILGGTSAISSAVQSAITELGYKVTRIAGTDRFGTAVAIADAMGDPTTVFEATGLNYPDALGGGPAAIKSDGVILLTNGSTQSAATAAYLAAHPGGKHYALGGPAAAADKSATPEVGDNRYNTAAVIADAFFPTATMVGVATGTDFPDALAAGPDLAAKGAPLLLVAPTGPVPNGPTALLIALATTVKSAVVFGGTASVSDDVASQLSTLVNIGTVTSTAAASGAFSNRYGVLTATIVATNGSVATTQVFDGTTGDVTTYAKSIATSTATGPTLAQLQAIPLDPAGLETAVNALFKTLDTTNGLTTTDADTLFVNNAAQVVLNPVTPPALRLATYAALAINPDTVVTSGVKDSTDRTGIEISAQVSGGGSISYLFDPTTGLPLENTILSGTGSVLVRNTINSVTTTSTLPTDPYTS